MATAILDGISTRYEVRGEGAPLLMFSPGGFDAVIEKWSSLGIYAKTKPLDYLTQNYQVILFDRRECGQSGGRVERVTWAHFVRQGVASLDHLKIDKALAQDIAGTARDRIVVRGVIDSADHAIVPWLAAASAARSWCQASSRA